ncbi:MAG: VapC toxin family PIN domain ribonuclease [Microbacteriaceae bacterium]|jgi:predicted nucleic acid-binding protein|nr:VapC toxin family PIN domain ribonuclease [Microbacteriaceae bacterium]
MAVETWIIDASALHRLGHAQDYEVWVERIGRGLVHISSMTLLEIGFSARNISHFDALFSHPLMKNFVEVTQSPAAEVQARETQRALVAKGQHRAPSIPDLVIAAQGYVDGHTVLHLDKDFDLVAEVTGQKVESLVVV